MPVDQPTASGARRLLARPGFSNLFAAGIASVLGFGIGEVCLVWIVFTATHSAWAIALYGLSGALAAVAFSLVGGGLADRYDRRTLMILADATRAVALAALVVDLRYQGFQLAPVLGANFVLSAMTTVFNPAEQTFLPQLVPESELATANGWVRSTRAAATFVGSGVAGGLIVTLGALTGVGLTVGTLAVSATLVYAIRVRPDALPPPGATPRPRPSFAAEIREGFVWLVGNPAWLQLTLSAMVFNFFSTLAGAFTVFYVATALHAGALVFGGLLAVSVAGNAVGALLVGRLGGVRYAGLGWVLPYGVLSGLVLVAIALLPAVPVALALFALAGVLGSFAGTVWLTAAQLIVPREIQGRYFGIDGLGSWAILPLAQIVGGVMVGSLGVIPTYRLAGILWVAGGLAFLLPRSLRQLRYVAGSPPLAPPP